MNDFQANNLIEAVNNLNKTLKLLNENIVSLGYVNKESSENVNTNLKSIDSSLKDIHKKINT